MMGGATSGPWQQQQQQNVTNAQPATDTLSCPNCKNNVSGKFCPECGHQK